MKKSLKRFAVIGNPIAHSVSPQIHKYFAESVGKTIVYEKIKTDLSQFAMVVHDFFTHHGRGLNITLPFKEAAFELATVRTKRAEEAKAANTLWMHDGRLCADNTDGVGLVRDLQTRVMLSGSRVLIVGAGGAARGIMGALYTAGVGCVGVYNRTPERLMRLCEDFPSIVPINQLDDVSQFDIIMNATSVRDTPWPMTFLNPSPPTPLSQAGEGLGVRGIGDKTLPFCYDLSYRLDADTAFVAWAKQQGLQVCDGLGMLIEQAAESFYIWHGVRPKQKNVLAILRGCCD